MSDTTIENSKVTTADPSLAIPQEKPISRDQQLADIRSGRRLERVVDSIKHFLEMQVTKIEQTLAGCEAAVENDRRLQQRQAEFQEEKHQWAKTREIEITRLSIAGDELAKAWAQLETERRKFLDSKTSN